ncbi:hypothetical protein PVK06_045342 [Gossypium arboreum]|uniref:Reverse transcriptase domain-containing protein n=1 Tax=Gossypium arboreum TaxID=29729 RepID=A0ABR0MU54_GOSAR|nr:hypothetical protein PVK06_045342 [Gossypium arboreum]
MGQLNNIDPMLGFNLEGKSKAFNGGENSTISLSHTSMDHDSEDRVLIGEEGKKTRGDIEDGLAKEEISALDLVVVYAWLGVAILTSGLKVIQKAILMWKLRIQMKNGGLPRDEGRMEAFCKAMEGDKINGFNLLYCNFREIRFAMVDLIRPTATSKRARVNWLKNGDKNTAFFHKQATQKRQRNFISRMQFDDGRDTEDIMEMEGIARLYFQQLFSAGRRGDFDHILAGIKRCILDEDNLRLKARYTAKEIHEARAELGPTKAPGEDGFPALFYLKYWLIIGEEVTSFCLAQLNRVIANRLRHVMNKCIDLTQSAFVSGRLICDDVLLAYEILHTFKNKRVGKKGCMAVKLDMSKAYDKVEWSFVEQIMKKLGFDAKWVDVLMKCVTTVSYSVVFNSVIGENFIPSRDFRQGGPLSPFLFLFCGEGLSSLMRLATEGNLLRGVKASRSEPQISHLLFANDCILFGEATERGANLLKRILHEYELGSDQCVNYTKSTFFFSSNMQEEEKMVITRVLGVRSSNDLERYLGLPNLVGRGKKIAFQNLKDRLKQRIDNLSIRYLSQ